MIRTAVFLMISAIGLSPALADPGQTIAAAAQQCWVVTDVAKASTFVAKVDARVEPGGRAFFRVASFVPDTALGKSMAASAIRALDRCTPYDVPAGLYHFDMTFKDPFKS